MKTSAIHFMFPSKAKHFIDRRPEPAIVLSHDGGFLDFVEPDQS